MHIKEKKVNIILNARIYNILNLLHPQTRF